MNSKKKVNEDNGQDSFEDVSQSMDDKVTKVDCLREQKERTESQCR